MLDFSTKLLDWYNINKRELPWRNTKDPYKIWLSEIILQQTRVEQGWKYYLAFIDAYPRVKDLAIASEQEVLKLWQGLGYYSRARNLHFTAQYIVSELDGIFPQTYEELLKLKGVGKYTAAAIASFAYDEVVPAIDGNVYRVLSRIFGIYTAIHTGKAEKEFLEAALKLIPAKAAADFNQAMMELGAIVCKPKKPNCDECPVSYMCWAREYSKWQELPVKKAPLKVKNRYFNYIIIEQEGKKLLHRREERDIWRHLYQFPLLEMENPSIGELSDFFCKTFAVQKPLFTQVNTNPIIHKLSHQHIHLFFWKVKTSEVLFLPKWHVWVGENNHAQFPVPVPINPFF